jgi:hypothetical protein
MTDKHKGLDYDEDEDDDDDEDEPDDKAIGYGKTKGPDRVVVDWRKVGAVNPVLDQGNCGNYF